MTPNEIADCIRFVLQNPKNEMAFSQLVRLCISMAHTFILMRHQKYNAILRRAGYTFTDLAVLSVEELFLTRGQSRCYQISRYFESVDRNRSASASDLLIALRKLIFKKVSQTIIEVAGEADPQYKRILRNIQFVLSDHSVWKTKELFSGTFYYRLAENKVDLHKPAVESNDILTNFTIGFSDCGTSTLVNAAFSFVEMKNDCRKGWTLPDLAFLLREYYALGTPQLHDEEAFPSSILSFEVKHRIDAALQYLYEQKLKSYIEKGAYSENEADCCLRAARTMLEEFADNTPRRLFDYYSEQFLKSTYEQYRENGRIRFEYLMQTTRDYFLGLCRDFYEKES